LPQQLMYTVILIACRSRDILSPRPRASVSHVLHVSSAKRLRLLQGVQKFSSHAVNAYSKPIWASWAVWATWSPLFSSKRLNGNCSRLVALYGRVYKRALASICKPSRPCDVTEILLSTVPDADGLSCQPIAASTQGLQRIRGS
jgi:hypothetical protein